MNDAIDPRNGSSIESDKPPHQSAAKDAPTEEWKRLAYEMAWTQYCHEDDLAQTRTNVSLTVQAAVLAVLAALAGPILERGTMPLLGMTVDVGVGIYSVLAILSSLFALSLVQIWAGFAAAGQRYMNLRLQTAFAIERDAGLTELGPASREYTWKRDRLTDELPTTQGPSSGGRHVGGWESLLATTGTVRRLWLAILLTSCASLSWVILNAIAGRSGPG